MVLFFSVFSRVSVGGRMVWLGLALWLVDWVGWVGLGWVDGRQAGRHACIVVDDE